MSSGFLPNPPKFGPDQTGPSGPREWAQFYRWLVSLWRATSNSADIMQAIVLARASSPLPMRVDNGLLMAALSRVPYPAPHAPSVPLPSVPYPSASGALPSGSANQVLATPDGAPGQASLRALVAADLPGPVGITSVSVVTGSRVVGTVYQNTDSTPRFISITFSPAVAGTQSEIGMLSGSANPPTTELARSGASNVDGAYWAQVCCWVLPGKFYKAVAGLNAASILTWTEWK